MTLKRHLKTYFGIKSKNCLDTGSNPKSWRKGGDLNQAVAKVLLYAVRSQNTQCCSTETSKEYKER